MSVETHGWFKRPRLSSTIFVWATIHSRTRDLIENQFKSNRWNENQPSSYFQIHFYLIWPFETPEYLNFIVTFSRKAFYHGFSKQIFAFLRFICSMNGILGIWGSHKCTNMPKIGENNTRNTKFQNFKCYSCAFKSL